MSSPSHEFQGAKYLAAQSQTMPAVHSLLDLRAHALKLVEISVIRADCLNSSESFSLARDKHPEDAPHVPMDIDRIGVHRWPDKQIIQVGQLERSRRRHCKHFNCKIAGDDRTLLAKEYFVMKARRGESVAEDIGGAIAIFREILSDFSDQAPVAALGIHASAVDTTLYETHDAEKKRIFVVQEFLKAEAGREVLVTGYGKGSAFDDQPEIQFLHALAHWSLQKFSRRGALLNMKAVIDARNIVLFSCRYYEYNDPLCEQFLEKHECCTLCNQLDLPALGSLVQ